MLNEFSDWLVKGCSAVIALGLIHEITAGRLVDRIISEQESAPSKIAVTAVAMPTMASQFNQSKFMELPRSSPHGRA